MELIVQKYGGSSIGTTERIRRVASQVIRTRDAGHDVVVVVSAMGDTTDELIDLAHQVAATPVPAREMDMLLTSGERVSTALLAMALNDLGCPACSLSGDQAGVLTDRAYGRARIVDVLPERIRRELDRGFVVLVAGFQGMCADTADVTTLGRGGSDTTAVALAAALGAGMCEIYTDVDGVCTADPRVVPDAVQLPGITYEEMLELAANGAKVLMPRCVEFARRHRVPVHVRSSFSSARGTVVSRSVEEPAVEQSVITGIAHDCSRALVVVTGVPDRPSRAALILRALADTGVEVDTVVQNASQAVPGYVDVSLLVTRSDAPAALAALSAHREAIGSAGLSCDEHVGKVSLVGAGMRTHPGVAATFCETLADAGLSISIMTTSEIRISGVCQADKVDDAVRALHAAFGLGDGSRARVYAGTGR